MYKAVVFDLDGTLIDSPLCFKTIRRELDIPEGEYILDYLETLPISSRMEKYNKLQEIELEAAKKAEFFPGALELLRELRNLEINVGLFTRNCRLATDHVLTAFQINIDMVVTRDDAPAKPHPAGLMKFLKHWNLQQQELLYVGDFRFDIECGKKAGVRTALFTNGQSHDKGWNPDYVVSDFSNFWKCIKQVLFSGSPTEKVLHDSDSKIKNK